MAECTYNGIEFSMIHVVTFDQEAIYEKSSTDYQYTKVTIKFDAIFSQIPDSLELLPPGEFPDKNISDTVVRVRRQLETPRCRLVFQDADTLLDVWGGDPNSPAPQATTTVDVKNGPFPKIFALTRFDGTTTYHVSFGIEVYIIECPTIDVIGQVNGQPPLVLTHRWTERLEMDKDFTASYSREGVITVPSMGAANKLLANADSNGRPVSFIPLRNGFRREHVEYIVSEDGLGLSYRIRDLSMYRQTPAPAIDAQGTCVETTPTGFPHIIRTVNVKLTGATTMQGGTQQQLLNIAVVLATDRLLSPNLPVGQVVAGNTKFPDVYFISRASITQDLWNNKVEIMMEAQVVAPKNNSLGLPFNTTAFIFRVPDCPTYIPQFNPNDQAVGPFRMPIPTLYGVPPVGTTSATTVDKIILVAAALGIPCNQITFGSPPNNAGAVNPIKVAGANANRNALVSIATGTTSMQLAAALNNTSPTLYSQNNGLFTEYSISTYYKTTNNILQLPTATPAGGSPKASIVQWANPVAQAIVEWTATAPTNPVSGSWPLIPSPIMQDKNMILLDQLVIPESPCARADGTTPQYRISGKYTYAIVDPTKLVLRAGLMPWMNDNGSIVTTVPSGAFSQSIFGTGGTVGTVGNISIQQIGS